MIDPLTQECDGCDCAEQMPCDPGDPGAYPGPDPDCECDCHGDEYDPADAEPSVARRAA